MKVEQPAHELDHADDATCINKGLGPAHFDPAIEEPKSEKRDRNAEPDKQDQKKKQEKR